MAFRNLSRIEICLEVARPLDAGSVGDISVTLGGHLEMSVADSTALAVNNPDVYVERTGLENQLLFGSGKIPTVKSYCKTLTPLERAPFHSNVRLPGSITDRDVLAVDDDIALHLDTLRKSNTPAGPRLTRLDKLVMGRTSPSRSRSRASSPVHAEEPVATAVAPEPSLDDAIQGKESLTAALGLVPVSKPQLAGSRRRSLVPLQVASKTPPNEVDDSAPSTMDVALNGLFSP